MNDPDPNSRGPESSNNVLQENNDNDNDNVSKQDLQDRPPSPATKVSRLISAEGVCGNCAAEDAQDGSVCCLLCKNTFHALCYDTNTNTYHSDNTCSKTTLTQVNTTAVSKKKIKRFGSFEFVCDVCITKLEQKQAADVKSHVHALETKMSSVETELATIKELLTTLTTTNCGKISYSPDSVDTLNDQEKQDNPWFDSARVKKLRHPSTVVICNDSGESVPLLDLEKIVADNHIELNNTFKNKSGNTVVTASSQADRCKLVEAINHKFPHSNLKQPKDKLPTISVSGIRTCMEKEDLEKQLLEFYPEIKSLKISGETFDVLGVRKQRNVINDTELFQAAIRVSNPIRKLIENRGDFLSVGLYHCKVYDHFHVKRCNRCQKFGHYKGNCKAKDAVCALCSSNHDTLECTEKSKPGFKPSCINCKNAGHDQQHTHFTTDRSCPTYQSEQYKLKNSIAYYSQKNL